MIDAITMSHTDPSINFFPDEAEVDLEMLSTVDARMLKVHTELDDDGCAIKFELEFKPLNEPSVWYEYVSPHDADRMIGIFKRKNVATKPDYSAITREIVGRG